MTKDHPSLSSRMRGYVTKIEARVGRLDVGIGNEIIQTVEAKLITSEDERLAPYDDFMPITLHCSHVVNGPKPGETGSPQKPPRGLFILSHRT